MNMSVHGGARHHAARYYSYVLAAEHETSRQIRGDTFCAHVQNLFERQQALG
jgi:hypothetical protein